MQKGKYMNFSLKQKLTEEVAKKQTSFKKVVSIIMKNNVVFHILLLREKNFNL